jgi:shikimate 5-dehydrogenase
MIGMNTDADGFTEPPRRRLPGGMADLRAVILVPAARGVGSRCGVRVHGSRSARGGRTGAVRGARDWRTRLRAAAAARIVDLLVNATPVGSHGNPGMPCDSPLDGRIVYVLVYDPDPTLLMTAARDAGVEAIGGIEMLVAQAERQFEIWTGQRPPAGLFREAAMTAQNCRTEWSER